MKKKPRGVGHIVELFGAPKGGNRASNGDYRFDMSMSVVLEGQRPRRIRRVHEIPKTRTHLVQVGERFPVIGDAKNPKSVEIDWSNYQRVDEENVRESECAHHLRWRIGHLSGRSDVWWFYHSPDDAAREIGKLVGERVRPHLSKYESLQGFPKKSARKPGRARKR